MAHNEIDHSKIQAQLQARQEKLEIKVISSETKSLPKKTMSRRSFLKTAGVAGAGVGLGYVASRLPIRSNAQEWTRPIDPTVEPLRTPTPEPTATPTKERIPSPERRAPGIPGYGFHLRLDADSSTVHTPEKFNESIDILDAINKSARGNKLTTARLALRPWQLASFNGTNAEWNEENLAVFQNAFTYAQERDLDIIATTAIPEFAHGWSDEDYLEFVESYYEGLVSPGGLHGSIRTLQVENETNVHAYRYINGDTYGTQPELNKEYFDKLHQVIEHASRGAKSSDSNVLITTSFSYAFRPEDLENAINMFTKLADVLDMVTLHFYPETTLANIEAIPVIIEAITQATGLPVAIGELGLPVQQADLQTQADVLSNSILTIRRISENVDDLIIYELKDAEDSADPGVSTFGLMTADGQGKASFAPVLNAMTGELPEETPTPQPSA